MNATSSLMASRDLTRRQFVYLTTCALGAGGLGLPSLLGAPAEAEGWNPDKPFFTPGQKLTVQPLFMYRLPTPKEAASWKSWGGVQTAPAVAEETARIKTELERMAGQAEFGLEILPLANIDSVEAVSKLADQKWDVTLVYACTGGGDLLRACLALKPDALVFVRHRSGPVYYWYEALSTQYLQTETPAPATTQTTTTTRPHVEDVVVDDYAELLWRLRALQGVKNFLGTRIVALGGTWGKYAPDAPQKSRERYGLQIVDISYEDFEPRIRSALADRELMDRADQWVKKYLALPNTALRTERKFVVNAFVLYQLIKDLMREHSAPAFTIKACMGTILPMAQTTACLSLELLNDEGLIAFCESDFVIIPAGLLLRHIAGKPVFLHNSTFPHKGIVTCAHCTCPRRLDTKTYEPAQLVTHYESDFGAAPKVDMPLGQEVTIIDPEYSTARWVGFKGKVKANPSYDICRSQQDVEVQGAWKKLMPEARDSHWVMAYGDYLQELSYAARKIGVRWVDLAQPLT
jgi:L-fucose isomerase-like protein